MKTVYISGKITGLDPVEVAEKFAEAEKQISNLKTKVLNPVKLCADISPDEAWTVFMKRCIEHLVKADEVHVLPCWKDSKGARMEIEIAEKLDIKIIYSSTK